jgi:hypothetical protein
MAEPTLVQQAIDSVQGLVDMVPENHRDEMKLLVKDLEEAKSTLFVRTAEAKPMLERCVRAAEALKEAAGAPDWSDTAEVAYGDLERAVSKLRNTILVRTQRAT